jgi:chemotaxis protein MotB
VRADQVTQVRGYADQFLRVKNNPYDPSNRRITILVKNQDDAPQPQLAHARVVGSAPAAANPSASKQ